MRIRFSREEAIYLKDQLDMWIEGYKDIDGEMPSDVVVQLLEHREIAEVIRERLWKRTR